MIKLLNNYPMTHHINKLELFYDNKSACLHRNSPKPNDLRPRIPLEAKVRPSELNFLRIMMRMPKPHALSLKAPEELPSPHFPQQKLIMISSIKNPQDSPEIKHTRIRKQLKRYISDKDFGAGKRLSTTKSKPSASQSPFRQRQQQLRGTFQNSGYLPALSDPSQTKISAPKASLLNDETTSHLRAKYKGMRENANNTIKVHRKQSKMKGSMEEKQEVKVESKYPMLSRAHDDLREVRSESWVLMEYPSRRIVVNNRSSTQLQIASLTKIMTFYTIIQVAQEHKIDIKEEIVTISQYVTKIGGTSAELNSGEEYTVYQLLHGLMLPSGNDAANQLAYWAASLPSHSLTEQPKILAKSFVGMMNSYAKQLGLKHTKFGNPHGLPHPDSKSTAADVARLSCACLDIPAFRQVTGCRSYKTIVPCRDSRRSVFWQNTNKLLRRQGFIGLKTGITVTAGPCLACAYQFRDKIYVSVILRALKVSSRFRQTRMILHWSLIRLFKNLTESEKLRLKRLKRHDHDLDSDNSEDEQVFKYDSTDGKQFRKRCNILNYEM